MLLAALWLLLAVLSGTLLTWRYLPDAPLPVRIAGGAATGLVLSALIGYGTALVLGLGPLSDAVAAILTLTPALWLRVPSNRRRVQDDLHAVFSPESLLRHARVAVPLGVALLAVGVVFTASVYYKPDPDSHLPAIYTGDQNNLGDLPLHLALATSFWRGQNIPPQDVEFAGVRMPYPFLVDFQTAQLYSLGGPLVGAMVLHDGVMAVIFFGLLYLWGAAFTGDRRAGAFTMLIVFFSGGLGFLDFVAQTRLNPGAMAALLAHLPQDYTIRESVLRWGNSVNTLLIPQRSLLLGLPLMLWVFWLLWEATGMASGRSRDRLFLAAGLFTATDVLAHSYAAVIAAGLGLVLAFLFPDRRGWLHFLLPACALSLPQGLWLTTGAGMHAGHFLGWSPGWDHGQMNIARFWVINTGLFLPLLAAGMMYDSGAGRRRRLLFYAPFLLCFLVPNLVRLAPWVWDNIKVLYPWFLFSVPWAAMVLASSSRSGAGGVALALVLSLLLCLSGMLDVWRVVSGAGELKVFSGEAVAFGEGVARVVPPRSVVLHAPTYDSSIYLSGALSVLGYTGHIGTRGLDIGSREQDQAAIYAGRPEAWALMARYHIEFVAVTPQEREAYQVNDAFFDRFPRLIDWRGYRLYQIPHI